MNRTIAAMCLIWLICPSAALAAGPNGECTCRYEGGDVVEGQTACIKTAKGMQLARCDRVLNNTSWKFLDQPCPTAEISQPDAQARINSNS